jgi:hypothetical protein
MNLRVLPVLVSGQLLLMSSAFAGNDFHPFTPAEKRAYHACLYASYINNYCLFHAWGGSEEAFRECVIAQGAGGIPPGVPPWGFGINDRCRALVQAHGL